MKRKRVLLVLLGLGLGLLLAEVGLRLYHRAADEVSPSADRSLEMEWDWARRHLRAGKARFESDLEPDRDVGWVNRPGLRRDTFSTNALGLRGAREIAIDKGEHKRILFVGDSYTWGLHVRDEETFVARLETTLPDGWEAMNLAVSGTGTDQQVLTFEKFGPILQADVVVLGFFVRDYGRNLLRFLHYQKPRFVLDGEGLRLTNVPIPSPEALYAEYAEGRRAVGRPWALWTWATLAGEMRKRARRHIAADAEGWQLLSRLMARFRRSVEAVGAKPVWLVLPTRDVLTDEGSHYQRLHDLCRGRAAELGVPCLDLGPVFRAHEGAALYRPRDEGGHLSVEGHRLVARTLRTFLEGEGLVE